MLIELIFLRQKPIIIKLTDMQIKRTATVKFRSPFSWCGVSGFDRFLFLFRCRGGNKNYRMCLRNNVIRSILGVCNSRMVSSRVDNCSLPPPLCTTIYAFMLVCVEGAQMRRCWWTGEHLSAGNGLLQRETRHLCVCDWKNVYWICIFWRCCWEQYAALSLCLHWHKANK